MKYTQPEMEILRFEEADILTESTELPIMPLDQGEDDKF